MTGPPERSVSDPLRRRLVLVVATGAVVVVAGVTTTFGLTSTMRRDLSRATDTFLEEQRIAQRIDRGLVGQLLAASGGAGRGDPEAERSFAEAGETVYREIQRYLFRTLSPEERLQLEAVKRQHQRLEMAAEHARRLRDDGEPGAAAEARREMFDRASVLLEELDHFLDMREVKLRSLRQHQEAVFRVLHLSMGVLGVILLGGSYLIGRFLYRRVSVPLGRLARASSRIAAGELDTRVGTDHEDEIGAVADSFNRMAEALGSVLDDLEARNRELASALEKVRETQAELVRAEKLGAVGRMTAGFAHELNNPLASVTGYAELLAEAVAEGRGREGGELEELVDPLVAEARRARDLVQNLLHFSRSSDPELGPVDLAGALRVVIGLRRAAFEQAGLAIVVEELPDVCVHAEEQRLQEVFMNLVNNALHAMREADGEGGTLRIGAVVDDGTVVMTFDDTGPGLSEPENVFEPFYTTKPVGEGTGLGLAITHHFMEEFGGSVEGGSSPEGGARFLLRLRLAKREDDPPAEEEASAGNPGAGGPGEGVPEATGDGASAMCGAVVLVVDDEPHLRKLQTRLLGRVEARAITAGTVDDAIEILERDRVDLVVSDVKMPGRSGIDLYRWIAERRPELEERFIFVTGDVHGPETSALAHERPDLFINKPFDVEEYLARIEERLEKG